MKTLAGAFSALVIGLTLAAAVPAAPTPMNDRPPRDATPSGAARTSEPDTDGPRVVTGRVVRVDTQTGTIVIQTPIGLIALRGPKEDLRGVNVGDTVEVEMVDGEHPSASPRLDEDDE